jgi:hypothetical protein
MNYSEIIEHKKAEELYISKNIIELKIIKKLMDLGISKSECTSREKYMDEFHHEHFVWETDNYFIVILNRFERFNFVSQYQYDTVVQNYFNSNKDIELFNKYVVGTQYINNFLEYKNSDIFKITDNKLKFKQLLSTIHNIYDHFDFCPNVKFHNDDFFILEKFSNIEKFDYKNNDHINQYRIILDQILKYTKDNNFMITPFFADFHLGIQDGKLKILNIGKYTAFPFLSKNFLINHFTNNKQDINLIYLNEDNIFSFMPDLIPIVFGNFFKINKYITIKDS